MATEEQTAQDDTEILGYSSTETLRAGQTLDISNRSVETLSFWLQKTGSPTGDVSFRIYAVDDDELLASKFLSDASALTGSSVKYTVTFNSAVVINEQARIVVVKDTNLNTSNYIESANWAASDIKAGEYFVRYRNGSWTSDTQDDMTYSYTYTQLDEGPTITQQPLTDITGTTATGNGTIVGIGLSSVTEHGHVWSTTIDPNTSDSKTTLGAGSLGVFTSNITGLTPTIKYYVRAYGTNTEGTTYSANTSFITGQSGTQLIEGNLAVVQTQIHYAGDDGKEYWIQGTLV